MVEPTEVAEEDLRQAMVEIFENREHYFGSIEVDSAAVDLPTSSVVVFVDPDLLESAQQRAAEASAELSVPVVAEPGELARPAGLADIQIGCGRVQEVLDVWGASMRL